ncbi:MAG: DegT/DnrJ/EryC1/StrS family aminotransferase [Actinomycetia bacterium]|nr:DegT/DnrJ/EryC1/StrS family aminotransferase [Actinomycetes bacterium]
MIPISTVALPEGTEETVVEALRSGQVAQGPLVAEFETGFAALTGVPHAVAVNNGTTALIAAIQVLELEPGDEVITSPFTFVATLNAILGAGATVRFSDISDADFNIDPTAADAAVNDRTRVMMPVHLYGQCADLDAIDRIVEANDLALVEDAAQAHGATIGDRAAGSSGLGCFSFYATKNLTTGEGGMVTTTDDALADRLRLLRNQGMRARYQYEMAGNNYRMTDVAAAIGLPQLAGYHANVEARRRNAAALTDALAGIEGLVTPRVAEGRGHVWHQYTVRVTDDAALSRDELHDNLQANAVGCGIYYPKLVHDYDCYRDHPLVRTDNTPVAARVCGEVLSLPVHPGLSDGDLDKVASTIRSALS